MDYDDQQINDRRPGGEITDALGPSPAVQWLLDYCRVTPDAQKRKNALHALLEWKTSFERESDLASLLELDRAGQRFDIPELRSATFPEGKDEALDDLSPAWQQRIRRLREAVEGQRGLETVAMGVDNFDGEPPAVEFGPPDADALYRFALRFDQAGNGPFPPELAAFWAVADGVFVDDAPFLAPIAQWEPSDEPFPEGIRIGCGQSVQGSLILRDEGDMPLQGEVLDVDDDGVELATYRDFAALVDALLGTSD